MNETFPSQVAFARHHGLAVALPPGVLIVELPRPLAA
jgi:hypothetical protein